MAVKPVPSRALYKWPDQTIRATPPPGIHPAKSIVRHSNKSLAARLASFGAKKALPAYGRALVYPWTVEKNILMRTPRVAKGAGQMAQSIFRGFLLDNPDGTGPGDGDFIDRYG